jgi:hypothetical protein
VPTKLDSNASNTRNAARKMTFLFIFQLYDTSINANKRLIAETKYIMVVVMVLDFLQR